MVVIVSYVFHSEVKNSINLVNSVYVKRLRATGEGISMPALDSKTVKIILKSGTYKHFQQYAQ